MKFSTKNGQCGVPFRLKRNNAPEFESFIAIRSGMMADDCRN